MSGQSDTHGDSTVRQVTFDLTVRLDGGELPDEPSREAFLDVARDRVVRDDDVDIYVSRRPRL